LLGVPLDMPEPGEIEQQLGLHLAGSDPGLMHVVTLNPEYVIGARERGPFRDAIALADRCVPDGVGVVLAVRALTGRRIQRLTGVELAEWVLQKSLSRPARIFLLGSPGSISELHGRFPTRVVGRWGDGTPDPIDDAESILRIRERQANVVLVGYGAPGQVIWIERNRAALEAAGVRIAIGVGGALDYLAGTVPRAPRLVRSLGLEWAYRLAREPWRWRRQLALPKFALLVAAEWSRRTRPGN
jgi:N-acetylglucosaminyldiphosphoundecaprenol N-acetyl-beta-D-mannosaminyltransferase